MKSISLGYTGGTLTPIKRKNLDNFYCIKISNLKWQRYTILIQLHTLSLVIVKKLIYLHTPISEFAYPRGNLHTPNSYKMDIFFLCIVYSMMKTHKICCLNSF